MDAVFERLGVDVWGILPSRKVDVMVTKKQLKNLKSFLDIEYQVIVHDVDELVTMSQDSKDETLHSADQLSIVKKKKWFSKYHDYKSIKNYFEALSNQHESLEFLPSIGQTFEHRDIFALKYSNSSKSISERKKVWIQAGIHAREWISHAVLQYIVTQLVTSQPNATQDIDFIFIPIVNPDGYVYSWERDRLWRKNRRADFGNGVGVDLNRNFPTGWGGSGSSSSPFSEIYQGPSAASEKETQILTKLFKEENPDLAIDLHAYSQLILRPFGYRSEPAPNEAQAARLSNILAKGIKQVHGKTYVPEREIDLYQASGTDEDFWASEGALAFTIELRPSSSDGFGGDGFILSPEQIVETGQEIYAGLLAMWSAWLLE